MIQEELNRKTISLAFSAEHLTIDTLKKAIALYLRYHKSHVKVKHGKISVKKLMQQDQGASTIEINRKGVPEFDRIARRYHVDYAVQRSRDSPAKYTVFFKARDTDVITKAFREFVDSNEKKKDRPSVRKKLSVLREKVKEDLIKKTPKLRQKDRGQTL